MRSVFLLLVLANVALFWWQYTGHSGALTSAPPSALSSSEGAPIVLLQERNAENAAVARPGPSGPSAPSAQPAAPVALAEKRLQCYRTGPYPKAQSGVLAEAATFLRGLPGVTLEVRQHEVQGSLRFWVRLPEVMTLAQARRAMGTLRKQGISDIALVRRDSGLVMVSLGVYSMRPTLKERVEELQRAGYHPQVSERAEVTLEQWLDLRVERPKSETDQLMGRVMGAYPALRFDKVACAGED